MSIPRTKGPAHPSHPGEHLAEYLEEYGLSQAEFARMISVKPMEISRIINRVRPVTAEMSIRLGLAFGQGPTFWIGLQQQFDVVEAGKRIDVRSVRRVAA